MNIKQIAKEAGVSVATVSRVLNHPEHVAPKTRERIQKIMEQEEYKPNWFAQGLNFNRTKTIGVVIPHILNGPYMEIAKGIEDVARQKEYVTFVCNIEKDLKLEENYIEQLLTRRVDGIILMFSAQVDRLAQMIEEQKVPVVVVGENQNVSNYNAVKVDCRLGARTMVEHLLENGYRSIGLLCGKDPKQESLDILEGYRRVLEEHAISEREDYIRFVDNTIEGGYLGAKKLIAGGPPSVIFTSSDSIAYGAMDAIKDSGLSIPRDIAVAGFGNYRMSNLVEPKLTTVEMPFHKMGVYGARLLFDLIEDGNGSEGIRQITLQTKLRIRKSCGHSERIGEMF